MGGESPRDPCRSACVTEQQVPRAGRVWGQGRRGVGNASLQRPAPSPALKWSPAITGAVSADTWLAQLRGESLSLWLLQERQLGFPGGRNPTFNWLTSSSVPTVGLPLLQSCLVGGIKFLKKDLSFFLPRIYFAFIIQLYFEWGVGTQEIHFQACPEDDIPMNDWISNM